MTLAFVMVFTSIHVSFLQVFAEDLEAANDIAKPAAEIEETTSGGALSEPELEPEEDEVLDETTPAAIEGGGAKRRLPQL